MKWTEESLRELPKRHVPWMHVFEWQQVCSDLYSVNIKERLRGYERLLLWRARYFHLPTGIRCTIELSHVDLLDKNVLDRGSHAGMIGEQEVQLMMSSSIMRFLNLLLECTKIERRDKTMRETLATLDIPGWLVEVRHAHAHHTQLPSIEILRKSVAFCLNWLLDNYWQEGNITPTLIVSSLTLPISEGATQIHDIFGVWDTLNIYIRNGASSIEEIKSKQFKDCLKQLFSNGSKEPGKYLKSGKLSSFLEEVCKKLLYTIDEYCCEMDPYDCVETIIRLIMQSQTFIPSPDLLKSMMSPGMFYMGTAEEMMKWVFNIWRNVLLHLQERYSVFPSLIHELLIRQVDLGNKISTQQRIISLWINVLCESMIKNCDQFNSIKQRKIFLERNNFLMKLDLTNDFHAKPSDKMGNFCNISVIKFAVVSPNELTPLFFPSLLEVAHPIISEHSKQLLRKLVSVYTTGGKSGEKLAPFEPIHTVQELTQENSVSTSKVSDVSVGEWYTCPLGSLPWIKGIVPSVDFPEKVQWFAKNTNTKDRLLSKPSSQFKRKRVEGKNIENCYKRKKSTQQNIYPKKRGKSTVLKRGKPTTVRNLSKLQKNN